MDWREQEIWDLRTEEIIQGMEKLLEAGSDYDFMHDVVPGILRTEAKAKFNYSDEEMVAKFGDIELLVEKAKARVDARR